MPASQYVQFVTVEDVRILRGECFDRSRTLIPLDEDVDVSFRHHSSRSSDIEQFYSTQIDEMPVHVADLV